MYLFSACVYAFEYVHIMAFFKNFVLLFYVYGCFSCMYVSVPHVCLVPMET